MASNDASLESVLEFIRENRGFDFTGYKRPSLQRRIAKRMQTIGIDGYDDYLVHLETHPDEFVGLFDTILINVTSFFRDPEAWEYVASEVVPQIVEHAGHDEIRVWVPGCASGEEAYTAAIVFFGAFLVTALAGMPSIDAKMAARHPEAWPGFAAASSILPFGAILAGRNAFAPREIGWIAPLAGLVLWAALLHGHLALMGVPVLITG